MFNIYKDYKGHDFERVALNQDHYICKKCKIKVRYVLNEDDSDYSIRIIEDMYVESLTSLKFNNLSFIGDILTLTCDEIIIKGIIE